MTLSDTGGMPRQPLLLLIETVGKHRFDYTKVEPTTGEAVWRWPNAAPLADGLIAAIGQVLDVSV